MNVQAKFRCMSIRHFAGNEPGPGFAEIELKAVWGDGKGNESWSKATPQGEIKMLITNPAAIEAFELGQSYLVDFTPVPRD